MKKIIILGFLASSAFAFSQINLSNIPYAGLPTNNSAFLDASSSYDNQNNGDNNAGKGLVFPQVDLTTFEFDTTTPDGADILPTFYDGMIVYNHITGKTVADATKGGVQVDVKPGFYYFSNPDGRATLSVKNGKWVRFGSGVTKGNKEPDYKDNVAVATGADFYISSTDSKPVYRRMIPLTFSNSATVTLASNPFTANDVFINAYLVKKDSKERIGSVRIEGDKVFSSNGSLFTVLNGNYYLIAEYYTK